MTIALKTPRQSVVPWRSRTAMEPAVAPDTPKTSVSRMGFQAFSPRSPVETRRLAMVLERTPVPLLTKQDVKSRWRVGPDTLRRILFSSEIDTRLENNGVVPLSTLLAFEKIPDPLAAWVMSTDDERAILRADLLTPEEVCVGLGSLPPMHVNSLYRRLVDGRQSSIRIGKQHRFRRTLEGARYWMAEHEDEA